MFARGRRDVRADPGHDPLDDLAGPCHVVPFVGALGLASPSRLRAGNNVRRREAHTEKPHDAEHQRHDGRCQQREEQYAAVQPHVPHARQAADGQRVNEPDAGPRHEQAERAADRRQQDAFRQDLSNQLHASGAERGTHRQLAAPAREPRQHQVRDVGADDQQQESDGCRNQQQRRPDRR